MFKICAQHIYWSIGMIARRLVHRYVVVPRADGQILPIAFQANKSTFHSISSHISQTSALYAPSRQTGEHVRSDRALRADR